MTGQNDNLSIRHRTRNYDICYLFYKKYATIIVSGQRQGAVLQLKNRALPWLDSVHILSSITEETYSHDTDHSRQ